MGVNKKVSPSLGHRMVSRSVFPRQQDPPGWQEVPALPAVSIPLWPLSFPMPPWAFPGSAAWWWGGTVVQGALITHQTCWHVISDGQPPHLLFISHLPGCSVAWQSLSLSGPCAPLQRTQGEKTGGQEEGGGGRAREWGLVPRSFLSTAVGRRFICRVEFGG